MRVLQLGNEELKVGDFCVKLGQHVLMLLERGLDQLLGSQQSVDESVQISRESAVVAANCSHLLSAIPQILFS